MSNIGNIMQKGEIRYFKYKEEEGHCQLISRCRKQGYEEMPGETLWWVYVDGESDPSILREKSILDIVPKQYLTPEFKRKINKKTQLEKYKQALKNIASYDSTDMEGWVVADCMKNIAKKALK